jgi:hypothetical protein
MISRNKILLVLATLHLDARREVLIVVRYVSNIQRNIDWQCHSFRSHLTRFYSLTEATIHSTS